MSEADRRGRHPSAARNQAIVERFVAGESYRSLAWDYGLSPERVAYIVQNYVRRTRQGGLLGVMARGHLVVRVPQPELRALAAKALVRNGHEGGAR